MDYFRNEDKWVDKPTSLYNNVLAVSFSNEGPEPVTVEQLKAYGKIENDYDDDVVAALGVTARQMCEQYINVGFIQRTVTAGIDNANGNFLLPYGPVTGDVTGVLDDDTEVTDIEVSMGQLTSPTGRLTVTYTGGHSILPSQLVTALKQQFLFLYENRGEGTTELSPLAKMILAPLRMVV